MHARNDTPSRARHFQRFLYTCKSQAHISFLADLPWCVSRGTYSVIQGSLNNHCSINTLDTLGVKLIYKKKKFFTCFVIGGKPSKGKTRGMLLGKLIFPPSTFSADIGGTYM